MQKAYIEHVTEDFVGTIYVCGLMFNVMSKYYNIFTEISVLFLQIISRVTHLSLLVRDEANILFK